MTDIPIGMAMIAVEKKNPESCKGCCLYSRKHNCHDFCYCSSAYRKDGKNVIFKLVDYSVKDKCQDCHVAPDDCDPADCERVRREM